MARVTVTCPAMIRFITMRISSTMSRRFSSPYCASEEISEPSSRLVSRSSAIT